MFDAATLHPPTHTKLLTRLAGRTVPWTMRARPARLKLTAVSNVNSKGQGMDYKLEVVAVPVSDVDMAQAFYERIGYHTDHDHRVNDHLRFV